MLDLPHVSPDRFQRSEGGVLFQPEGPVQPVSDSDDPARPPLRVFQTEDAEPTSGSEALRHLRMTASYCGTTSTGKIASSLPIPPGVGTRLGSASTSSTSDHPATPRPRQTAVVRSPPMIRPEGPTGVCTTARFSPVPHPRSTTVSPGSKAQNRCWAPPVSVQAGTPARPRRRTSPCGYRAAAPQPSVTAYRHP